MKPVLRVIAAILAVLLSLYFLRFAATAVEGIDLALLLSPRLVVHTFCAALLYSLVIPVSGWAWSILLQGMGAKWGAPRLTAIMGLSQFAKYIPGNVGQHVGRASLSLGGGMPARDYFTTVVVETVLVVAAALVVGLSCLTFSSRHAGPEVLAYRPLLALTAVGLIASVLLLPLLLKLAARAAQIKQWTRQLGLLLRAINPPGPSAIIQSWVAYCGNYLAIGLGLWLIAKAIDGYPETDYLYLTATFSFSWLLGFVAIGAPAGLGVREGTMALMLGGTGQNDAVLVLIAAVRIATLLGDALCFAGAAAYFRLGKSKG